MDELSDAAADPPARIRITGQVLTGLLARAPVLWPLLRKPVRSFFDEAAPGWDARTASGSPEKLAALSAACLRVDPTPERILDIGTGTGVAALLLAREFPSARIRGVDISEQMIREAQSKVGLDPEGRVVFRTADASALPYEADSFDMITQLNVPPFFAEIARVVRPGGTVIVASTLGARTPFFTPHPVLDRGFAKHGIEVEDTGSAGSGTWWLGKAARN